MENQHTPDPDHEELLAALDWVPESCTPPTTGQPLRTAEFDDLFRDAVAALVDGRESPRSLPDELASASRGRM